MRRLSDTVKRRIVEHLACYQTHHEVANLIACEFAVNLTARHIRVYDPTSFQFAAARRWADYHRAVRDRCTQELAEIAISHRVYRMSQLQRILGVAMDRDDLRLALKILEQAAKEMGNCYVR